MGNGWLCLPTGGSSGALRWARHDQDTVAAAVQALQSRQVNRIILTRPAVEAGERLGFLPGDLMAKVSVIVPTKLTEKEKELFRQLSKIRPA